MFTCDSFFKWRTTWLFNGGNLPLNAVPSHNDLTILDITNVKKWNSGYYECSGFTDKPNFPEFVAIGTLNITGKYSKILTAEKIVSVSYISTFPLCKYLVVQTVQ